MNAHLRENYIFNLLGFNSAGISLCKEPLNKMFAQQSVLTV